MSLHFGIVPVGTFDPSRSSGWLSEPAEPRYSPTTAKPDDR
jgi:hypothetical protein